MKGFGIELKRINFEEVTEWQWSKSPIKYSFQEMTK